MQFASETNVKSRPRIELANKTVVRMKFFIAEVGKWYASKHKLSDRCFLGYKIKTPQGTEKSGLSVLRI